jgi:23S rRNA (guanosine2251-2'-O)-methyltransferase
MKKLAMDQMNRMSGEEFRQSSKLDAIIVLEDIRSMMNIGSVFRTADAFRVDRICLCGITATPPHREIHKTALGATETVRWEYHSSCAELLGRLKNNGVKIIAVEQLDRSIMLDKWDSERDKPIALVFGNEVNGVSEEALSQCDYGLEIPQYGTKHSLNISVTAGIVLWEVFRSRKHQLE